MSEKQKRHRFWLAEGLIIVAAVLYCSWPLGFVLNPMASREGLASELGAVGQPYNWLFITGDVVSGAVLAAAVIILYWLMRPRGWARLCLVALAVYGICGALDASLPLNCLPSTTECGPLIHNGRVILHGTVDLLGSGALIVTLVAAWLAVPVTRRQARNWIIVIGLGGVIFAALSGILLLIHLPGYWAQRYYITLSCIWVASIPFVLRPLSPATTSSKVLAAASR